MAVQTFQAGRLLSQAFWRHGIWLHKREHIVDIGNLAFPYGNGSYPAVLTGKWMKKVSYQGKRIG